MNHFSFEFPNTNHLGKSGSKTKPSTRRLWMGWKLQTPAWFDTCWGRSSCFPDDEMAQSRDMLKLGLK